MKNAAIDAASAAESLEEAQRRIAARDRREEQREERRQRCGRFCDAIHIALSELDNVFDKDDAGKQLAIDGLLAALDAARPHLEAGPTFEEFEPSIPAPAPTIDPGVNGGFAPAELEAMLADAAARRGRAAALGREGLVRKTDATIERLTATLDATRRAGITDETVYARRDRNRADAAERWKTAEAQRRSQLETWRLAPALAAQPNETLQDVMARVLVERGHTRMAALKAAFGIEGTSDTLRDTAEYKRVKDAVRAQQSRSRSAPVTDLSPEEEREWEAVIAERDRSKKA